MRILVTGAAGYIGSQTCNYLKERGHYVIGIDRNEVRHTFFDEFHSGRDFSDIQDLLQGVDGVAHIAATSLVGPSMLDPSTYYKNNVQGTLALLDACKEANVNQFVFASSAACYGEVDSGVCRIEDGSTPLNPYGWSKRMTEIMLTDYARAHDISSVSLRFFNVAGADADLNLGQEKQATHIIARIMESAMKDKPFTFYGNDYNTPDGTCIRDYVHVKDIAHGISCAFAYLQKYKMPVAKIFNLGSGSGYSNQEVFNAITEHTPLKPQAIYAERREGDPAKLVADVTSTEKLHWTPKFGLDEIIKSAYNYYSKTTKTSTS